MLYTVSTLNAQIKKLLETEFPLVWITGEISNFRTPGSGHCYFTLKDASAQISCVMFAGQKRRLNFLPEDGMRIKGVGRVGLYTPRGTYQIIFEQMEPYGAGELQAAFERLKRKLAQEELFDSAHKKPVPFLPRSIGIVASPTGAVVHDILRIVDRRFSNMRVRIIAAKVQGDGAAESVIRGIKRFNSDMDVDVIIIARGGGSLEDLQAFNTESVARAIFASHIPIVSAIGHETDYTISDFTADLRAPTPSAAAELTVPVKTDLLSRCSTLSNRLTAAMSRRTTEHRNRLMDVKKRLMKPDRRIDDLRLRLDDAGLRMLRIIRRCISDAREQLSWRHRQLDPTRLRRITTEYQTRLRMLHRELIRSMSLENFNIRLDQWQSRLTAYNPEAVVQRGYGIVYTVPDKNMVKRIDQVEKDQTLDVMISDGVLRCRVTGVSAKKHKKE